MGKNDMGIVLLLIVGGLLLFSQSGGGDNFLSQAAVSQGSDEPAGPVSVDDNLGDQATLSYDAYTGSWGQQGAKTEVWPTYSMEKSDGTLLLNDAASNSTTTANVGDTVTIYGTGATYYLDPKTITIGTVAQTEALEAYTVVGTTDLVLEARQDDGVTALTADDNANNTADYAGGSIGAGETYSYFVKIKNNVNDETYRLGAIATGYCGAEADDYELYEDNWKEVTCPDGLTGASVTQSNDTLGNITCSWKNCYVPESSHPKAVCEDGECYIPLYEFDSILVQTVFDADDTTQPAANGLTYAYFGVADLAYEKDLDSNDRIRPLWYAGTDGQAGNVGLDESLHDTMTGLDVALTIEPQ